MNLIDHFKSTMQQHFPEHDLSLNECDDNEFLDNETNAMWMMFQVCNAWQPIETAPKDGTKILAVCMKTKDKDRLGRIQLDYFDKEIGCFGEFSRGFFPATHWHPLPIPPLTTEGGV